MRSDFEPKEIIAEGACFRLSLGTYTGWYAESKEMFELRGIVDGHDFFIIRREPWDFYKKELIELGKSITPEKGFFKHYATYDHPLDEFKDEFAHSMRQDAARNELVVWMTEIAPGIWRFTGNHEEYSGVFSYIIWDKDLIQKVMGELEGKIKEYEKELDELRGGPQETLDNIRELEANRAKIEEAIRKEEKALKEKRRESQEINDRLAQLKRDLEKEKT